jgi:hypothetical protein
MVTFSGDPFKSSSEVRLSLGGRSNLLVGNVDAGE